MYITAHQASNVPSWRYVRNLMGLIHKNLVAIVKNESCIKSIGFGLSQFDISSQPSYSVSGSWQPIWMPFNNKCTLAVHLIIQPVPHFAQSGYGCHVHTLTVSGELIEPTSIIHFFVNHSLKTGLSYIPPISMFRVWMKEKTVASLPSVKKTERARGNLYKRESMGMRKRKRGPSVS